MTLPALRRPAGDRPLGLAPAAHPSLRLVQPPRRARRYLVIGLLLAAIGVFGVVSLHALATEAAFQARDLERDVDQLALDYDDLVAEVAVLESPQHIKRVAIDELGMVPATEPAYLVAPTDAPPTPEPLAMGKVTDPLKQALGQPG
jgi:cell division protein FtsL